MEDKLIGFEVAKLAKEKCFGGKGFTTPNGYFRGENLCSIPSNNKSDFCGEDEFSAPTQSLLQKWLREVHDIDVVSISVRFTGYLEIGYWTYAVKSIQPVGKQHYKFKTYEEALEQGLLEGLKLIITNKMK